MDDTTYNGLRGGYETWVTALWLDNDACSSDYWHEQARDCWTEAPRSRRVTEWQWSRQDAATIELADRLRESLCDGRPSFGACVYDDLLKAALDDVDWKEIAEHYLQSVVNEEVDELRGERRHD